MWKTIIVENVVGCDVDRAKAIVKSKAGNHRVQFDVRQLPDNRTQSKIDEDEKNYVVLWIKQERDRQFYVSKRAKFQVFEKDEFEEFSEPSDVE
jgi:hypothetical protein